MMSLLVTYNCVCRQNLLYVTDSSYEKATILRYLNLFFLKINSFILNGSSFLHSCSCVLVFVHLQDNLMPRPKQHPESQSEGMLELVLHILC